VRIPFGHWVFEDKPPFKACVDAWGRCFLDLALQWAEKHRTVVVLDLHAPPGGCSGDHHSGRSNSEGNVSRRF
jgi:aryl-phospho-beta-D-glucosidase BglC (GH1 family)